MIDPTVLNAYPATNAADAAAGRPRLHPHLQMRRDPDDRTAGSIPVWQSPVTDNARQTESGDFKTAMNYADAEPASGVDISSDQSDEFSFGDLVDIVNPLHHIPLVNTVYESVTGDTIKPSGRIIGGAVFGGFVGAAAGIANVIVEEETGKDMTGNVVAFVTRGDLPQAKRETLTPEEHLNQAARLAFNDIEAQPLPAMALGMQSPKSQPPASHIEYERYRSDDDRTAGTQVRRKVLKQTPLPASMLADPVSVNLAALRASQADPVTQIKLSPLPRE